MLEIYYKDNSKIIIEDSNKKWIVFDFIKNNVELDWFLVSFPWEYEKSAILLEVKEYENNLFYNFLIDWKHLIILWVDEFNLKEEILDFLGDIDILLIKWSKNSIKLFENLEAKIVIPYWEWKDIFLNNLGQKIEEVEKFKQKWELPIDNTWFVNLKMN